MSARTYVPVPGPAPSDLPDVGAITPPVPEPATAPQRPMQTLLASAARITETTLKGRKGGKRHSGEEWQEDAWEMYDLVGEMRFLTNVLAAQGAKARFYVGTLADDPTDPPIPTTDTRLSGALEAIGDGPTGLSQLIKRLLVNLQVPGDGWLVGIPEDEMPGRRALIQNDPTYEPTPLAQIELDDLEWRMLSVSEVDFDDKDVILKLGGDKAEEITVGADDIYLIRVWSPHPRKAWEADSPTRSTLPVLRELVGLTMHISAQIDSRLAGAGVLLVPSSAARAAKIALGLDPDDESDPFTEALIETMITPISDRSNAAAYVPAVWTVPDETTEKFVFLDFAKPLDAEAKGMRDEAIRRYALSADAPPELLLGLGSMNHWGAWLVQEDVVRAHLEPPLALVADALTTQYLRPVMEEIGGYTEEQIENTVVWYDVEHLIVRVSKGDDASRLYDQGVINSEAVRNAHGFSEDDAPEADSSDPAVTTALEMVSRAPSLAQNPGLVPLVAQLREIMGGEKAPVTPTDDAPAEEEVVEGTPEPTDPVVEEVPAGLSAAARNSALAWAGAR